MHMLSVVFFFFNDTATTEIYTLSLHDALPIFTIQMSGSNFRSLARRVAMSSGAARSRTRRKRRSSGRASSKRSEEHTSELQSHSDLVCRLLLEKKKKRSSAAPAYTQWQTTVPV